MSVLLLRAADKAAEGKSKTRRIAGWIAGLGIVFALLVIIVLL
jgi:hypothetical protein